MIPSEDFSVNMNSLCKPTNRTLFVVCLIAITNISLHIQVFIKCNSIYERQKDTMNNTHPIELYFW